MTLTHGSTQTRVAALAIGLALSLSVVMAPAAVAQDGDSPLDAIQGLVDAIESGDIAAVAGSFCAEFTDEANALDLAAFTDQLPPGIDVQMFIDALTFSVEIGSMEVTSQTEAEATVSVVASLAPGIDLAAIEPLLVTVLEAGGQEATPERIAGVGAILTSMVGGRTLDIDEEIVVVANEDGTWGKICSELGAGDAEASADAVAADGDATTIEGG